MTKIVNAVFVHSVVFECAICIVVIVDVPHGAVHILHTATGAYPSNLSVSYTVANRCSGNEVILINHDIMSGLVVLYDYTSRIKTLELSVIIPGRDHLLGINSLC